jgi:hypothetical protein
MSVPRSRNAPSTPQKSRRCCCAGATRKYWNTRRKTNRLSTLRAYSMT